jgi:hypothetical protein
MRRRADGPDVVGCAVSRDRVCGEGPVGAQEAAVDSAGRRGEVGMTAEGAEGKGIERDVGVYRDSRTRAGVLDGQMEDGEMRERRGGVLPLQEGAGRQRGRGQGGGECDRASQVERGSRQSR